MTVALDPRPAQAFAPPARGVNALSVDVEDWYHVCGAAATADPARWDAFESRVAASTARVLSLLRQHRARATFFVLGSVAERQPDLVRAMLADGHEVATHGHFHRRVYEQSPAAFAEDLSRSLDALAAAGAPRILGHRAAEWSLRWHTRWALPTLRRLGIRYDSSMVPLAGMGDPRFPRLPCRFDTEWGEIAEFPLTTARCLLQNLPFSGGLPLRLAPLPLVLAQIARMNRDGRPALIYLHPWELDPDPPRLPLPLTRRLMHDFNLPSAPKKLEALLERFRFAPLAEVLGLAP